MTNEEAINTIEHGCIYRDKRGGKALGIAVTALEKQIPKKPVTEKDKVIFGIVCGRCPYCDSAVYSTTNLYCHNCGQALDWSATECHIKK